jgi:hypothetical protein
MFNSQVTLWILTTSHFGRQDTSFASPTAVHDTNSPPIEEIEQRALDPNCVFSLRTIAILDYTKIAVVPFNSGMRTRLDTSFIRSTFFAMALPGQVVIIASVDH